MLKKILIGVIAVVVALLLIGFAFPGKFETSKSITINAPAEYVFEEINDLEKNPNWSYWNSVYTDMTTTYGETKVGVGAISEWDGPESGKGKMTITESVPFSSIKMDLDFMEEGTATAWYTFEPEGDATKVTSGFETELGMNPFMRWIGVLLIKPEMEKAYDYNLNKLKEIAEAKPVFSVPITMDNVEPVSYISVSSTLGTEDTEAISAAMAKSYGELMGALQKAKVELAGPPFCLYPRWDPETKTMDMVCALPVAADAKLPAKYPVQQSHGGAVVKAVHKGDYATMEATHNEIVKYLEFKKLEMTGAPWEVYITDPMEETDTTKWITEIYYPISK